MNIQADHSGGGTGVGREADSGMFALLHAADLMREKIERALESVGLSWAKFGVLSRLAEVGEPLPLGEIAGRVHCVRSNMTQLIDRLEAEGLVQRTKDPSDRRIVRAELTPFGREQADAGARQVAAVQAEFSRTLSESDRSMLGRVLSLLK